MSQTQTNSQFPLMDFLDIPNSDDTDSNAGAARPQKTSIPYPSPSLSKKRTRATPEQLAILEETFQTNTSPNAKMREILGERLGMNERSIQIWFQNRRAKVKLLQKKASTPKFGMAGRSNSVDFSSTGLPILRFANAGKQPAEALFIQSFKQKAPNTIENGKCKLSVDALTIGTWRRVALTEDDLEVEFGLTQEILVYQIIEAQSKFKLEFELEALAAVAFEPLDCGYAQLTVQVSKPPKFYMHSNGAWTQCRDFTENHQATAVLSHILRGPVNALYAEILSLTQENAHLAGVSTITPPPQITPQITPQPTPVMFDFQPFPLFNQNLRRGSCPEMVFENPITPINPPLMTPIDRIRRDSLLLEAYSPIESPHSNVFSPNLNDAFTGLTVFDEQQPQQAFTKPEIPEVIDNNQFLFDIASFLDNTSLELGNVEQEITT